MKKIVFTTIAFFYLQFGLISQRPRANFIPKIDSLENLLKNPALHDTTEVIVLNDLARNLFLNLQYKQALITTKNARQLSKDINFTLGEGLYLRTMFVFMRHYLENFDLRAKWYFNELNYEEKNSRFRLKPSFNLERVLLESETKQLLEALQYFEQQNENEFASNILLALTGNHIAKNELDKGFIFAEKGIKLAESMGDKVQQFLFLIYKLYILEQTGRVAEAKKLEIETNLFITKATDNKEIAVMTLALSTKYGAQNRRALTIDYQIKSLIALEKIGDIETQILIQRQLANEYQNQGLTRKAADGYIKIIELKKKINDQENIEFPYVMVAFRLIELNELEEAKKYLTISKTLAEMHKNLFGQAQNNDATGQLLVAQGKYKEAIPYFLLAYKLFEQSKNENYLYYVNLNLAKCHHKIGAIQEAKTYGLKCYNQAKQIGESLVTQKVSILLSDIYEQTGQPSEAFKYLKVYKDISLEKEKANVANELADIQIKAIIQKSEEDKLKAKDRSAFLQKLIGYFALALFLALIFLYFLNKNFKNKKKANQLLENTLTQLKATQAQLVQSEKLASLGELTAGIAHEIQNPLNFVNNFSEVSNELIQEIQEERKKTKEKRNEDLEDEILNDISKNLEKITDHGKRASSIVKGMLEHSRNSTGEKELTDINAMADEYLRLAYHGLRAKDKSFNVNFKTELDPNLPKIKIIPQDFGRVLLNLINNAFYAVGQKYSVETGHALSTQLHYKPTVTVSTQQADSQIIIKISDNGSGMSPDIKAKIFQPFFTTKPTGEGTGLGLSLAYDIITKGHGGTIVCESKEGEGTTFTISIPL